MKAFENAMASKLIGGGRAALVVGLACWSGGCEPDGVIVVTSTADGGAGSLRAAIDAANRESSAPVRIELAPGTYALTRCEGAGSDEDANAAGDLDVTTSVRVSLVGSGAGVVIRQTCAGERVLDEHGGGLLRVSSVEITGGALTAGADGRAVGGGVRAVGDVVLDTAIVRGNSATARDGSGAPAGGTAIAGGGALGGGLFVAGSLISIDSTIEANTAQGGMGGNAPAADGLASAGGSAQGGGAYVAGAIMTSGGTLASNRALGGRGGTGGTATTYAPGGDARGGALAQAPDAPGGGDVTATASVFTSNTAVGGDIAVTLPFIFPNAPASGTAAGGALAARGRVTARDVSAARNSASSRLGTVRGGAIAGSDISIQGGSYVENAASRNKESIGTPIQTAAGGAIAGSGVRLTSVTLTGNSAANGGAVSATTLSAEQVTAGANTASNCGGALHATGLLSVRRSRIADNTSVACGGGVAAEQLEISDTLVAGNLLQGGAQTIFDTQRFVPVVDAPSGAGIFAKSVQGTRLTIANNRVRLCSSLTKRGLLTVTNRGGGMRADTATLVNVTITGNVGPSVCTIANGDQVYYMPEGLAVHAGSISFDHATVTETVVATHFVSHRSAVLAGFNPEPFPLFPGIVPKPQGTIDASSYNFYAGEGLTPTGPGDRLVGADPLLLGALADNGGAVPTRAPAAGSPLIDYVPPASCPVTDDARGVSRPQGPGCDVGAVEVTQ